MTAVLLPTGWASSPSDPCRGVEPGGECTIDCQPSYTNHAGETRQQCTYRDGTVVDCAAHDGDNVTGLTDCHPLGAESARINGPVIGALLGAAGAGGITAWIIWRRRAWALLPLFSRVEEGKVLDQPRRRMIFEAIEHNPGIARVHLRRELELPNGDLQHHLRTLQRTGIIVAQRTRGRLRFYAKGTQRAPDMPAEANRLLASLSDRGPRSLEELRREPRWSRSKVRHWAQFLEAIGKATSQRSGRSRLLRPTTHAGTPPRIDAGLPFFA